MTKVNTKNLWTIIDVSEEARDEAKKRAKLENKKIGRWISDLILEKENMQDNSEEIIKSHSFIAREIDEIKLGMKAIYDELIEIKMETHPLPKQNFFSKFLR